MKAHIETINGKVHVTIGKTKYILSETSAEIQSSRSISVKTVDVKEQAEVLPLPLPSRVRKLFS